MDLYTLDTNFLKRRIIDNFSSAIWTERYTDEGDVILVVDATPDMITELSEGRFLALSGSKEIMIIETQSIEKNQLTITGNSLLGFLKNRIIRTTTAHDVRYWYLADNPGLILTTIVQEMCIGGIYLSGADVPDGSLAIIPNLTIGDAYISGSSVRVAVPFGPVYDALKTIAETYEVGMSLYLHSANVAGYSLKFKSYNGVDRTSDQMVNPRVRFSPATDSLTNIKELRSIAGYKNVAYAYAPSFPTVVTHGTAYADVSAPTDDGFDRRVLMIFADDLSTDEVGSTPELESILDQRARDGLANNNFTRVVDGEVVPQNQYTYGVDYRLGDVIELEGLSGLVQKARITEYIRSQDSTGERAYPTVSVIE